MTTQQDDLDKIGNLLLDFFGDEGIRKKLGHIHNFEISGWEKWWQTELAMYLAQADDLVAEWDMEHPFDTDRRTSRAQNRMALDIGFRLNRHAKNEWHFVELKQDDDYRRCIDKMCEDAEKVFSARKYSFDGICVRYIACAGVFLNASEGDVLDYADAAFKDFDIPIDGLFLEQVGAHHSLLIF